MYIAYALQLRLLFGGVDIVNPTWRYFLFVLLVNMPGKNKLSVLFFAVIIHIGI